MLVFISSLLITLALIFYSLGVWAERLSRYLKKWHVISFWIGLFFDITGTYAMHLISEIKDVSQFPCLLGHHVFKEFFHEETIY